MIGLGRSLAYTLASAALYVLGFAGFDVWPLALVCLVPLLRVLDEVRSLRQVCLLGIAFGTAVNLGGYYWLLPMLERFSGFGLVPSAFFYFVICALQGGQLLTFCLLLWFARRAGRDPLNVAPFAYAAGELVYPLLFPSYLGNALHDVLPAIQLAELGGPTLVSLLVVAVNASAYSLLRERLGGAPSGRALPLATLAAVVVAVVFGVVRIGQIEREVASAPRLRIGVVQGDTGLFERREDRELARRRYIEQSRELQARQRPDLLVWPETALLYPIRHGVKDVDSLLGSLGTPVIFGAMAARLHDGEGRLYNTAFLADADGRVKGQVDKTHLLPFGEYLPFGDSLPWLYDLSPRSGQFTPGEENRPLVFGGRRLTVLICYEDVLPGFVRDAVAAGGQLLVNLTNDAWFGDTTQPHIHLALAKFRAVEHRRFLVRSTGTGVSAIVDPTGRVLQRSRVGERVNLVAEVAWLDGRTLFARMGDWPGWGSLLCALYCCCVRRRGGATAGLPAASAATEA